MTWDGKEETCVASTFKTWKMLWNIIFINISTSPIDVIGNGGYGCWEGWWDSMSDKLKS